MRTLRPFASGTNLPREEVAARKIGWNQGFAEEFVRQFSRPIQFLWIDGNPNCAREDYLDWPPFLAAGARVAFHDAVRKSHA